MKTNGYREIDLTKTKCRVCDVVVYDQENKGVFKVLTSTGQLVDCTNCNTLGYVTQDDFPDLRLENETN